MCDGVNTLLIVGPSMCLCVHSGFDCNSKITSPSITLFLGGFVAL